jgi:hypothetical protein
MEGGRSVERQRRRRERFADFEVAGGEALQEGE